MISKFRKVVIEIAKKHKGLADSIILGVTKIINQYGKVIVLEDDLEVSGDFLDYMQRGLVFYQKDNKVWSIAGHCPVKKGLEKCKDDVFLAPRVESLGWWTWSNRWSHMDWEVSSYNDFKKDYLGQFLFNLGGNDLCKMLRRQMADRSFESWAIRWCYQEFRERKYTVYPKESRIIHCGNDDRSTHGSYYSVQQLKAEYSKCVFKDLRPDFRLILSFRKANSDPSLIKQAVTKLKELKQKIEGSHSYGVDTGK